MICLNDRDYFPLVHNDPRFNFTSTLVRWLEYWRSLQLTQGRLTAQTFTSFVIQVLQYQNM